MGKGTELLALLRTGNSGEARKTVTKLKKQGKKKILAVLNEQDDEGCTPLHYAAAYNFLDFIEEFLELGSVVDVEDNKGYTPLHLAATNGRAEAVSVLLCRGADPDIASRSGDTPIHLASHNGHNECVEALIREHAKCTMLNVSGQSPLDLACQNGHTEVVALLLRSGQFNPQKTETSQTSLKLAAKHGHTQVLSVLIKHGFDINRVLPGAHGTCLHEAALYGKIEAVHYLLQCGANPSIKNTQGLTALDIVNHYTDPRSAQQLKQLLKDAISKTRMSQNYQQQQPVAQPTAASNQRYSYTLPHNSTQHHQPQTQQQQPQTQPGAGVPPQGTGYSSATLPHSVTGSTPHHHQGYNEAPPQVHHASSQPQLNQQRGMIQKQMSMPVSYNPVTQQHTGIPSMAEMIASKAANRKPMATSPTRRGGEYDNEGDTRIRSATMAAGGMTRPSLTKQRRNSFSEESGQDLNMPYNRSNPPTLPRRAHPPTFKPVPPPSSPSQEHGNILPGQQAPPQQQPVVASYQHQQAPLQQQHTMPYQQQQTPPQQHQGLPQQHQAQPQQQQSLPPTQRVSSSGSLSFSEQIAALAAKKNATPSTATPTNSIVPSVTPSNTPPIERKEVSPPPVTLENELLAKLKRRQESKPPPDPVVSNIPVPDPKPQETIPVTEPPKEATPPTVPRPTTVSNQQNISSSVNPPGPLSPTKPAPKPKAKPPVPKPKEDDKPRALTWQEELAKRRSENPAKDATPPPEKKAPPPTVKAKPKPTKPSNKEPVEPPKPQPKPQRTVDPKPVDPQPVDPPKPHPQQVEPPKLQPVEPPKPQPVEPPKPQPVEPPKPHPQPVEHPKPQPVEPPMPEPPKPQPAESPKRQPPKPHPIEIPKTNVVEKPKRPNELKEENPSISKLIEDDRPSTPSSDQMSRSTSFSSIASVPMPSTPGLPHNHQFGSECVPINDWLATYKLTEYLANLQNAGYDNTDFLIGITMEELIELGVAKAGHRKRILTSLGQLLPKEHYLTFKPASVAEWLQLLGLSQYESEMIDNGYDDVEFITSVTEEELLDIGITKKGHLKRFKRGIVELSAMQEQPSAYIPTYNPTGGPPQSPTHSTSNLSSISQTNDRGLPNTEPIVADKPSVQLRDRSHKPHPPNDVTNQISMTSSVDSGIEAGNNKRQSGNFMKMKQMLAKNMGIVGGGDVEESEDHGVTTPTEDIVTPPKNDVVAPPKTEPVKMRPKGGPPPIPKRATSTIVTTSVPTPSETTDGSGNTPQPPPVEPGTDDTDSGTVTDTNTVLTTEDINEILDQAPADTTNVIASPSKSVSLIPELDDLDKALQGFTDIGDDEIDLELEEENNDTTEDEVMLRKFEEDVKKEMEDELKTDQMLADIDDMLADLNTHLDIMIPPTS